MHRPSAKLRAATAVALLAASLALAAPVACAAAQDEPVVTTHRIGLSGKPLAYTAETGRLAIRDTATGEAHGYMFYTAYRVSSAGPPRPVMFVWNGGPGADSSLLHFSAVGPRRLDGDRLVDNAESWLAFTDLVLVDPVGTGYSRPARAEYAEEFYGTLGDVASVTEFVRAWRVLHDASASPLWLAGESWGAGRAANVAYQLEHRQIPVAGMVLISGGWGLEETPLPAELHAALQVVDMATTARFHQRIDAPATEDLPTFRARAEQFARTAYAPALARLGALNAVERESLAKALAGWTGIPAADIDRKSLTISPRQFRKGLLRDTGREPYVFDLRRTDAPAETGGPTLLDYWRRDLGYRTDLTHLGLEPAELGYAPGGRYPEAVNERWNYATKPMTAAETEAAIAAAVSSGSGPPRLGPPLPGTAEAIALDGHLRVLVAGGLYDSFLPCAVGSEIEHRLQPPLKQSVAFHCYVGGHAMYLDEGTRGQLMRDVRALVTGR